MLKQTVALPLAACLCLALACDQAPSPTDDGELASLAEDPDEGAAEDLDEGLALAASIVDIDGEEVGPGAPAPGDAHDPNLDLAADSDPAAGYVGGEAILVQVNSGMCLQAIGYPSWSFVRQEYCNYGPAQQWDVQASFDLTTNQTVLRFENVLTGLCLHSNNGWLRQVSCGPTDNQAFVDHDGGANPGIWVLESRATNRCFDIPSSAIDPQWVQDYPCHGNPNQQFLINVQSETLLCE